MNQPDAGVDTSGIETPDAWQGYTQDNISIIIISIIRVGFSDFCTSVFPNSRLRFFRLPDFGFSELLTSTFQNSRLRFLPNS